MTTTPTTDLELIEHLDFEHAPPCSVTNHGVPCGHAADWWLLRLTLPCARNAGTVEDYICDGHKAYVDIGGTATCLCHGVTARVRDLVLQWVRL